MKKILNFFLIFSIIAILIFFQIDKDMLSDFSIEKIWNNERPSMLLLAIFFFFFTLLAKSLRFYIFFLASKKNNDAEDRKNRFKLLNLFSFCYAISYFLVGSGVLVKTILLKKRHKTDMPTSLSLILIEKSLSLLVIIPIVFYVGSTLFNKAGFWQQSLDGLFILTVGILLMSVGIIFRRPIFLLLFFFSKYLSGKLRRKVKRIIVSAHKGFSLINNFSSLFVSFLLTFCIWLGEIAFFYASFQFQGLNFDFIDSATIFLTIFTFVTVLPVAGGVGTFELGILTAADLLNYRENLLPFALFTHMLQLFLYAVSIVLFSLLNDRKIIKTVKQIVTKQKQDKNK